MLPIPESAVYQMLLTFGLIALGLALVVGLVLLVAYVIASYTGK